MTLPLSGPLSLGNIQAEFGGSNPISFNEYYKNGPYVRPYSIAPNVPTIGPISISNFYGAEVSTPPAVTWSTSPIQYMMPNQVYGLQLIAINAVTYSITSGSLPTGLTMSSSGLISGTPTGSTTTVTITATSIYNVAVPQTFTFTVLQLYTTTYTSDAIITLPPSFNPGTLTVSLYAGGGGGGGGPDRFGSGYPGYAGFIVNGNIRGAVPGDSLIVAIGGGGYGGYDGNFAVGGAGGTSNYGYPGGDGGRSGPSGTSGSGGGGGAATVLLLNGLPVAVAGGGGGGGGAGQYSSGIPNDGIGGASTLSGENGQWKGGDGGGGGGGGGGLYGGLGGPTSGGDDGAYSGQRGNSLVPIGGLLLSGSNGGGWNNGNGGPGSATISYYA